MNLGGAARRKTTASTRNAFARHYELWIVPPSFFAAREDPSDALRRPQHAARAARLGRFAGAMESARHATNSELVGTYERALECDGWGDVRRAFGSLAPRVSSSPPRVAIGARAPLPPLLAHPP